MLQWIAIHWVVGILIVCSWGRRIGLRAPKDGPNIIAILVLAFFWPIPILVWWKNKSGKGL